MDIMIIIKKRQHFSPVKEKPQLSDKQINQIKKLIQETNTAYHEYKPTEKQHYADQDRMIQFRNICGINHELRRALDNH